VKFACFKKKYFKNQDHILQLWFRILKILLGYVLKETKVVGYESSNVNF
jgi:hypothetical protein